MLLLAFMNPRSINEQVLFLAPPMTFTGFPGVPAGFKLSALTLSIAVVCTILLSSVRSFLYVSTIFKGIVLLVEISLYNSMKQGDTWWKLQLVAVFFSCVCQMLIQMRSRSQPFLTMTSLDLKLCYRTAHCIYLDRPARKCALICMFNLAQNGYHFFVVLRK